MASTAHALHILVKHKEIAEDIIKQLGTLKSDTYEEETELKMRCELEFNIPVDVDIDQFKISFENLSHVLNVDYIFRRIR